MDDGGLLVLLKELLLVDVEEDVLGEDSEGVVVVVEQVGDGVSEVGTEFGVVLAPESRGY